MTSPTRQTWVLILDLKLPDMTGIELFRMAREVRPGIVAIMITAYSSIDTAIEAMKIGAYDYITKPFNVEKLLMVAGTAIEGRILSGSGSSHFAELTVEDEEFGGVVGSSLKMRQLLNICRSIAPTNATVLIYGESGTGKELVAS
ncbi:MAG TPA: response regulator, partial [Bacillota bacterium]|nr:response regulator [Bacillota bacterium]